MADLFASALSGLNAAQQGIVTTEHNIANASTPGFSRQQIVPAARLSQQTGAGFIGKGVDVQNVTRIYDQYLSAQVLQEQSQATYLTTYYTELKQIDNLVADPAAGASPAMQSFFDAMSAVSNNPESVSARQTMLGNAQFAVNRFQAIDQRMTDIATKLSGQITSSINAVNSYAEQIAALNLNIRRAIATIPAQQPNDLLDQRDQLITKLNQEIRTSQVQQPDGTVSVFVGNGQPLVLDDQAMKLQAVSSPSDPGKLDIAYLRNGQTLTMQQNSIQGGNIGGYLTFRDQSLEPARNALGRVALGLATSINQQNRLGQDLNGVLGLDLFATATPRVIPNANNATTSGFPSVTIANVTGLTTSDYQLKFNGGASYTLLRLSDNTATNYTGLPQTVDGMTINAPAPVTAGDTFLIRPTANGARDIAVATNDPAKIAAAAPMRATAALTNSGTAKISSGTVISPLNANVQLPVTLTFNTPPTTYSLTSTNATIAAGGTNVTVVSTANMVTGMPVTGGGFPVGTTITVTSPTTFTASAAGTPGAGNTLQVGSFPYISGGVSLNNASVVGGVNVTVASTANLVVGAPVSGGGFPAGTTIASITNGTTFVTSIAANPVAATGQSIQVGNTFNGWVAQISGSPAAGDIFTIGPNTNATGDNRNILLMSGMQTQNLMANGTASFQGIYGQLVGDVGAKTSELSVTSLAQTNMAAQTVAAQQAVSGVNLDEEAANLMRYQKEYQAAAKAMQIASTLFDSILAIGR